MYIDLHDPPSYASSWSSLPAINKLADSLTDVPADWTLNAARHFRNSLHSDQLYHKIIRDFHGSINSIKIFRGNEHATEVSSDGLSGTAASHELGGPDWDKLASTSVALGLELGICHGTDGKRIKRLILEVDGCTKLSSVVHGRKFTGENLYHNWTLPNVNIYDRYSGSFRDCDYSCEEGSVTIARSWKDQELVNHPRLQQSSGCRVLTFCFAVFSTNPACVIQSSAPESM